MAWSIRPYVVFVWGEMFPDAIACRVTSQVVWSKNSSTLIHKRLSDRLRQPKVQYTLRRQAIGWHEQCGMTGHHKTIPYGHRAYGKRHIECKGSLVMLTHPPPSAQRSPRGTGMPGIECIPLMI